MTLQSRTSTFYQVFKNYKIVSTKLKSLRKWIFVALIIQYKSKKKIENNIPN